MDSTLQLLKILAPIFAAVALGLVAKRKQMLSSEQVGGLQQFAVKIGLPCVVFNACLTARIGAGELLNIGLGVTPVLLAAIWAFRERERKLKYHNLPQLFAAHETGMLGIPLTMALFGAAESYRMGVLDLGQALVAFPTIAILSSDTGDAPSVGKILKGVLTSPLLIMSFLGLGLNLTGIAAWMDQAGALPVVTEATGFLSQPVSALMLFSVGYHFSIDANNRGDIFKVSGIFLAWFGVTGVIAQGVLALVPGVEPISRWVLLLYFLMPGSYLAPGLGRSEKDQILASGVCSVLTAVALAAFCVISAIVT